MYGTSLGIDLSKGSGVEHGHEPHPRHQPGARTWHHCRSGGGQGHHRWTHACLVKADKPFVLVGSVATTDLCRTSTPM